MSILNGADEIIVRFKRIYTVIREGETHLTTILATKYIYLPLLQERNRPANKYTARSDGQLLGRSHLSTAHCDGPIHFVLHSIFVLLEHCVPYKTVFRMIQLTFTQPISNLHRYTFVETCNWTLGGAFNRNSALV